MRTNIKKTYTGQYILTTEEYDIIIQATEIVRETINNFLTIFNDPSKSENENYVFKNKISGDSQKPLDLLTLYCQLGLFASNDELELTPIIKDE